MRGVLFDYGLTLVEFERPDAAIEGAQEAIARLIRAAGHAAPPVATLRAAVHDRVEREVKAHEAAGSLEEIDVAALEHRAFVDIGLDLDAGVRDACSRLVQEAWFHGVRRLPDAAEALRALRAAGMRIGVCSNAAYRPASMRDQLRHVGLDALLDASVFSSEVGWRKPSPRLFAAALTATGTSAADTVFVGDRMREDIAGARNVGMRTVLVRRRDPLSAQEADPPPDAVISSLTELPPLLLNAGG